MLAKQLKETNRNKGTKRWILGMLTCGASLIGNILTGKGVMRAG